MRDTASSAAARCASRDSSACGGDRTADGPGAIGWRRRRGDGGAGGEAEGVPLTTHPDAEKA